MKVLKEVGLIVLGMLVSLTIVFGMIFNSRLTNIEMAHNNLVKVLTQAQQQQQQRTAPNPAPAPVPAVPAQK